MQLHKANADILVPDGLELGEALARTTHLAVGAHQDDLEIMAFHGILECFGRRDRWFCGVTCTNGAGSARSGVYADYTDAQMAEVRLEEQRAAARIGRYGAVLQLGYSSAEAKNLDNPAPREDLVRILDAARPEVVYTHNPADKHPTHIGVVRHVLAAIRAMPAERRPARVYGCEVWRDLDWLPDSRKVVMDVGGRDGLAAALVGVYDSQIAGGKRYDLATLGRRRANATYFESHDTDASESITFAMDLTPVTREGGPSLAEHVEGLVGEFRALVGESLAAKRV